MNRENALSQRSNVNQVHWILTVYRESLKESSDSRAVQQTYNYLLMFSLLREMPPSKKTLMEEEGGPSLHFSGELFDLLLCRYIAHAFSASICWMLLTVWNIILRVSRSVVTASLKRLEEEIWMYNRHGYTIIYLKKESIGRASVWREVPYRHPALLLEMHSIGASYGQQ